MDFYATLYGVGKLDAAKALTGIYDSKPPDRTAYLQKKLNESTVTDGVDTLSWIVRYARELTPTDWDDAPRTYWLALKYSDFATWLLDELAPLYGQEQIDIFNKYESEVMRFVKYREAARGAGQKTLGRGRRRLPSRA